MRAIISDIHSNLEALQAVMADIEGQKVKEIYCPGDVVGYGPNPRECIDLVMQRCSVVLLGNHDQAVLFDPVGVIFNPTAERAILWTREQLQQPCPDQETARRRLDFLNDRPSHHREEGLLFVHASPCNPVNEYVYPEHVYDKEKMDRLFAEVEHCCFMGHTHVPCVFIQDQQAEPYDYFSPDEIDYCYQIGESKLLVSVGSVGQPRDGDCRASYVLLDGESIHFCRVEYDIEATIRKMERIPELAASLVRRLQAGR